MKRMRTVTVVLLLCVFGICLLGCVNDKFLDPTQIGRFRQVPSVNVILDSLGVAEETPSTWENAEDPKPIDIMMLESDYVFSPGDVLRVQIFELFGEGQQFVDNYIVTETGKISIPEVGTIDVAGLTESQLEEQIRQILMPSILKEPSISVLLINSQQRTFSIAGLGIPRPSRYEIPRSGLRLKEALAIAGGVSQFNISYIYVTRQVTGKEEITEMIEPEINENKAVEPIIDVENKMLEIIAPRAQRAKPAVLPELTITVSEMITTNELTEAALPEGFGSLVDSEKQSPEQPADNPEVEAVGWVFKDGKWVHVEVAQPEPLADVETDKEAEFSERETIDKPIYEATASRIEWIFQDGKWIPVQVGQPEATAKIEPKKTPEPLKEKIPEEFDWDQMGTGGQQVRVIRIPADKLDGGDAKYNVVIRPGDNIHVPVDIIGECFVMGNTNNTGAVPLTGRPLTLKMLVAASGGLGPLAWPKKCEITRRIEKKKEETVMVDLDKIASGEQPDFFIKPLDLINIGTHPTARWRAVLRNAFRATYGFGFLYDRNFSERDFSLRKPLGPFLGPDLW